MYSYSNIIRKVVSVLYLPLYTHNGRALIVTQYCIWEFVLQANFELNFSKEELLHAPGHSGSNPHNHVICFTILVTVAFND